MPNMTQSRNAIDEFYQKELKEIRPVKLRKPVAAFYDWAEHFLISIGALDLLETSRGHFDRFSLNTIIGEYRLDFSPGNILCYVHGRFGREKAGYVFTKHGNASNPYSGKWNHGYSPENIEVAKQDFEYWITRLVSFQPTPEFWSEVVKLEIEQDDRKNAERRKDFADELARRAAEAVSQ